MDENKMIVIATMFARQQIMIQLLIEQMASGQPWKWTNFSATFNARWKKESTEMTAIMLRRLQSDHLTLTMDDLELEGLGPSSSEETDDD